MSNEMKPVTNVRIEGPRSTTTTTQRAKPHPADKAVEMALADGQLTLGEAALLGKRGYHDDAVTSFLRKHGGSGAVAQWNQAKQFFAAVDSAYADVDLNDAEIDHLKATGAELGYSEQEMIRAVEKLHGSSAALRFATGGKKKECGLCPGGCPENPWRPLPTMPVPHQKTGIHTPWGNWICETLGLAR